MHVTSQVNSKLLEANKFLRGPNFYEFHESKIRSSEQFGHYVNTTEATFDPQELGRLQYLLLHKRFSNITVLKG